MNENIILFLGFLIASQKRPNSLYGRTNINSEFKSMVRGIAFPFRSQERERELSSRS